MQVEKRLRLAASGEVTTGGAFEILAITAGEGNGWKFPASLALWDGVETYVEVAQSILAGFDPAASKMERIAQAGFGMERLLAALWEKVVEGDGTLVEEIQVKINEKP